MYLSLPQAVDVTVFAGGNFLTSAAVLVTHAEAGLRLVAGIEEPPTGLFADLQLDPLNVVFLFHRMGRIPPNTDLVAALDLLNERNVLFGSRVFGLFLLKRHKLAAAVQRSTVTLEYLNDIAAMLTFVDLPSFGHFFTLSLFPG
jgi:hypothetical protein